MKEYYKINPNAYFAGIRIHDRVWEFLWGWGLVVNIDLAKEYPVEVVFANKRHEFYNFLGKFDKHLNQSLFWDVVHIDKPPCPKIPIILRTIHDILNTSEGLVELFGQEIMVIRSKDNNGKMIYSYSGNKINPEWIEQAKIIDIEKIADVVNPKRMRRSKLSIEMIQEIRALRGKKSPGEIAKIYKISSSMVNKIQLGKNYRNILNPDRSPYIPPLPGLSFTPQEIQEIRALRGKQTQTEIAKMYGISTGTVCSIQHKKIFKDVSNPDGSPYVPPSLKDKLTPKEIQEIRILQGKETMKETARRYGISISRVCDIQFKRTHKNILNPDKSEYIPPLSKFSLYLITPKEIQEIRALRGKKPLKEIADIYGGSVTRISDVQLGKTYRNILNPDKSEYIPPPSGFKLTPQEFQEIQTLRGKKTQAEIAKIYKVSASTVFRIQSGEIKYIQVSTHERTSKKLSQELFAIPDIEIRNIRRLFKEGMDISILAEHFSYDPSLIYKVVKGRIFKDVLDIDNNQYVYVPRARLSKKIVKEIKKSHYEDKMSTKDICLKYHVSNDDVIKIIHNLIYRNTGK